MRADTYREPSISIVIVAYHSLADLRRTLPALVTQLRDGDELMVVDNAAEAQFAAELATIAPRARVIVSPGNVGFAAAVNAGAEIARGDLLVLLNPDVRPAADFAEAIRRPWGGAAAAWMGLVTLDDETRINTSGGVVHFTGFGWAGQVGEGIDRAPRGASEVGFLSGACLAIPRRTWSEIGGFAESFFMYCEDVDLSLRLRLRGATLTVVGEARVAHEYDFAKGPQKWRMLERNRLATILRTYPTPVLLAVAPALLATEPAIWAVAARGGWLRMKALATLDLVRALPRLVRERRTIQAAATVSPAEFASHLVAGLDSPYFGAVGRQPLVRGALALYWRCASALLGA